MKQVAMIARSQERPAHLHDALPLW